MKRSEMNAHQLQAFDFIVYVMSELIAGQELVLEDFEEDSEEYKNAKEYLSQPKAVLAEDVYNEVMNMSDKSMAKHLRFAGKDFIMERINKRLEKWGYQ